MKTSFVLAALLALLLAPLHTARATGTTGGGQPLPTEQPSVAMRYMICWYGIPPSPTGGVAAGENEPMIGEIAVFTGGFVPGNWHECNGALLSTTAYSGLFSVIGTTYGGNGTTHFAVPDLRGRIPIGYDDAHPIGSVSGSTSVILTPAQMAEHTHSLGVSDATGPAGSSAPVNLAQPSLALNFMMATQGTFQFLTEVRLFAFSFETAAWKRCDGRIVSISQNTALFSLLGNYYGGDGRINFAFPDLRGRTVIGAGGGPGLTPREPAAAPGQSAVMLTPAQLPPHTHTITTGLTGSTGGGQPVDQMQPSLALHTVIVDQGIYPGTNNAVVYSIGSIIWRGGRNLMQEAHLDANGAVLARPTDDPLRSITGNAFGGGGPTFALPDCRGRAVKGLGGPAMGTQAGSETLYLTESQLPPHSHTAGPGAQTLSPDQIFARSAYIHARVNPLGLTTTAQFQHGLTTAYGNNVPLTLDPPNGTLDQFFHLRLTGLTPQTTYHYRVLATNADGTTTGADLSFTTRAEIPRDIASDISAVGFGNLILGQMSPVQPIVISNAGDFPLTLTGITLTGGTGAGDFRLAAFTLPPALEPGETFTVNVRFAPGTVGPLNTVLRCVSNDPDENPYDIPLSGIGVNRPPFIINGGPPMQRMFLFGGPLIMDMHAVFSDPDGHTLEFELINQDGPVFAVIEGRYLAVDAQNPGIAHLTVLTRDPYGASTDTDIIVHVAGAVPPPQSAGWRPFTRSQHFADGQWLEWESVTGHRYRIEWSSNLTTWQTLIADLPAGADRTSFKDTDGAARRFYRVAEDP